MEFGTVLPQYKWALIHAFPVAQYRVCVFFLLPAAMSLMLAAPAPPVYPHTQPLVPKIQHSRIQKPHFLDFKQASPKSTVDIIGTLSITPHRLLPGLFSYCSPQSSFNCFPLLEPAQTGLKKIQYFQKKSYPALTVAIRGAKVLSLGCFDATESFVPIITLM